MNTKIYLIRHGKSIANDTGLFGGITDYELSETGKRQAEELKNKLKSIDKIYSSPLKRAIQTIQPLAAKLGQEINIEPDLIEINVGEWENISRDILRKMYPEENKYIDETEHFAGMKGQEDTSEVAERMYNALKKIAEDNKGKCIICVSHIVAIRAFICKIKNYPFSKTKELIGDIPNTGYLIIEYDHNKHKFIY